MNLIDRIEELAETLPRPAYSVADETGNAYVIQWMLEDGLQVRQDEYGNIIGRIDGEGAPIRSRLSTLAAKLMIAPCGYAS